jgi:uncharacterized protein YprB with RNaseH-like and TPR domain
MSLERKLKELSHHRAARPRRPDVDSAWARLKAEEGLSVKEKLERLITLTKRDETRLVAPAPEPWRPPRGEGVRVFENSYVLEARYGRVSISMGLQVPGDVLMFLGRDSAFETLDLSSALFIDLETTGLAGGTGTVPFLVGMGFYRDGRFKVVQAFLADLAEEERFLDDLTRFFEEMKFRSLVTYNGKAFDIPLLETRYALQRRSFPLDGLPHLDFLFSARGLWKHQHESCRLLHLAREIVHADRDEDIPGAEIPTRYFQYLRSGDFSLIEPILYHNQEDILSLLGVVVSGARLVSRESEDGEGEERSGMDLVGVARLHERVGNIAKSVALFERALRNGGLSGEAAAHVRKKLSVHFKRARDWDKALGLWREKGGADDAACFRELAMYYEHREKNYDAALGAAEEGWALAQPGSAGLRRDFEKRIARLKAKAGRRRG